jgi:hypothetical protein
LEGLAGKWLSGMLMRNTKQQMIQRFDSMKFPTITNSAASSSITPSNSSPQLQSSTSAFASSPLTTTESPSAQSMVVQHQPLIEHPFRAPHTSLPLPVETASASTWTPSEWAITKNEYGLLGHVGTIDDRFLAPLDAMNKCVTVFEST